MSDFLAQQKRDIRGRLAAVERELLKVEHLVEERERLQAALRALEGGSPQGHPKGRESAPKRPRRAGRRGSGRETIIKAVEQSPGATAGDVAKSTGLSRNTVAASLSQLRKAGVLEKRERGYAVASKWTWHDDQPEVER